MVHHRGHRGERRDAAIVLLTVALIVALLSGVVRAQTCDDSQPCTFNDACVDGVCRGTFETGASCDDGNACTINETCQMGPGGACREGTPAPIGTSCSGGCGTCQPIGSELVTCGGPPSSNGQPCDPGLGGCIEGTCLINNGVATCVPRLKMCPDTDGNPCTDTCDFSTGECSVTASPCLPTCETCNPGTGACEPANLGGACDDGDPCTAQSRCAFNDVAGRTFCTGGTSGEPSPTATGAGTTATVTPGDATATPTPPDGSPTPTSDSTATASGSPTTIATPTASATAPDGTPGASPTANDGTPSPTEATTPTIPLTPGACVGDCDGNGVVTVNELVTGVTIALGSLPASACTALDLDASAAVEVNELIAAVNALLNGCS